MSKFPRRRFSSLLGRAAVCAGLVLAAPAALARAPLAGKQVPGAHRMNVGAFEVTSLLDGYVEIDPKLLKAAPSTVGNLLTAAHLPKGPVRTAVNAFLVNTGDKLVLIDAGTSSAFGPTVGKLPESLALAGVDPAQVDEILITHLHPDHVHGLLTPEGTIYFPNATVHVAKADVDFWGSDEVAAKAPAEARPFFAVAKKVLTVYGQRIVPFSPGAELVPGIRSVEAIGHTPGHTCYLIESQGKKLMAVGDILHVAAVQFAEVNATVAFDTDSKKALATRKRLFDRAAKEGFVIAATHLPFPGVGYVRKTGKAYVFDPLPWQLSP
jgi:glyoxylase-like metal-dependent hydrolase (beta-lactamase superfamily II)